LRSRAGAGYMGSRRVGEFARKRRNKANLRSGDRGQGAGDGSGNGIGRLGVEGRGIGIRLFAKAAKFGERAVKRPFGGVESSLDPNEELLAKGEGGAAGELLLVFIVVLGVIGLAKNSSNVCDRLLFAWWGS